MITWRPTSGLLLDHLNAISDRAFGWAYSRAKVEWDESASILEYQNNAEERS